MNLRVTEKSGVTYPTGGTVAVVQDKASKVLLERFEFPNSLPKLPEKLKKIDPDLQKYETDLEKWYTEFKEVLIKSLTKQP